jgi:hypothetical protein
VVSLRLRIAREGETVKEDRLSLDAGDKNALAKAVSAKPVELAGQVPLERTTL